MTVNDDHGNDLGAADGKKKLALNKPAFSSTGGKKAGIQLKKPSTTTKYGLRSPNQGQLKGSLDHNEIQNEDDIPGLRLIQSVENNEDETIQNSPDMNATSNSVPHPGVQSQSSGLRLKKSSATSNADLLSPPSTVQRKRPEMRDTTSTRARPKLQPKDSVEGSQKSKLSTPGSLHLKRVEDNETTNPLDTNSGLRLRKPSPAKSSKTGSETQSPTSTSHASPTNHGAQEDVMTTLSLKKPKDIGGKNKLGLASASQKTTPDLTPPGLENPANLPNAVLPRADEEKSKTEEVEAKINLLPQQGSITPPAQKVQFARKRKAGLAKKQKQQIIFIWIPAFLLISCLGFMFVSKLLTSEVVQENTISPESERQKPKPQSSRNNVESSAQSLKEETSDLKTDDSSSSMGIAFPDHLLQELEDEYGLEAKEQFLKEWLHLSDEDRSIYLQEIEAENDELEEAEEEFR